jgi:hypothetical protein
MSETHYIDDLELQRGERGGSTPTHTHLPPSQTIHRESLIHRILTLTFDDVK